MTHTHTHTQRRRRRGTLRKYLEENRKELMEETSKTTTPARNPNKTLWWIQKFISKEEMTEKTNFWKKRRHEMTTINI